MNRFSNISFAVLCGVSVLATSPAGFAIKFGEVEELDEQWKGATSTIGKDIDLLQEIKGTPEEKIRTLSSKNILQNLQSIYQLDEMKYEPANSLMEMMPTYAEKISTWIYPSKNQNYNNLFNQILTNPSSLQKPVNTPKTWADYRRDFDEASKKGDKQRAFHALQTMSGLAKDGDHAADNWLFYSRDNPLVVEFTASNNPNSKKDPAKEKGPVIDLDKQWAEARKLFLDNYRNTPEIAKMALDDLHKLAIHVPAAKAWVEFSSEVLAFATKGHDGKMEQPFGQPIDQPNFMNSPQAKVQFHKDRQALKGKLKPIMDQLKQLPQNANVHVLDKFYTDNVGNLVAITKEIFPENGKLSLEQVKTNLKKFIESHPQLLVNYRYENKAFSKELMFSYIDKVYQNDMPVEVCSHTYELAIQVFNFGQPQSDIGIHRLFDIIVENYATQGGCLQGRRNRQFGALASMLALCGLS